MTEQLYRQKIAILWLTTGVGSTVDATIQSFTFLNRRLDGFAPPVTFDSIALLFSGILCSLWIVPGLLALVGRRPATNWASLVLGGFLVATSTVGGLFDGVRDGLHIAVTAIIAVALPGFFAIRASWRLVRVAGSTLNGEPGSDHLES